MAYKVLRVHNSPTAKMQCEDTECAPMRPHSIQLALVTTLARGESKMLN
jgi:hypothetical protein